MIHTEHVGPRRHAFEMAQAGTAGLLLFLGGALDHWTGNDTMTPAGLFCYSLMVVVLGLVRHTTPLGWRRIGRFVWDPPFNNQPIRVAGRGLGAVLVAGIWLAALVHVVRSIVLVLAPTPTY